MGALEGVAMELDDCAFSLLSGYSLSDEPAAAFDGVDVALLVGSMPRKAGMERSDLLEANGGIFTGQGRALNDNAGDDVRVLVVGNPANTNCLIAMRSAPDIPQDRFCAMTRLDHNRAIAQLAAKAGATVNDVTRMTIWGNHSATQYPDVFHAQVDGTPGFEAAGSDQGLAGGHVHPHGPEARRGDHRRPRLVVGCVGRQRGDRPHPRLVVGHTRR